MIKSPMQISPLESERLNNAVLQIAGAKQATTEAQFLEHLESAARYVRLLVRGRLD